MNKQFSTRKLVLAALFLAIGILLPMVFHSFNLGGQIFLPMHIPSLVGGLVLGPSYGVAIGSLSVILNSLLTGMPPVYPMLPIMGFELATYGLVAGYLRKNRGLGLYPSLILAMIAGRIVAALVVLVMSFFGLDQGPLAYAWAGLITGLPGIAIQLIFVPAIARAVEGLLDNGIK